MVRVAGQRLVITGLLMGFLLLGTPACMDILDADHMISLIIEWGEEKNISPVTKDGAPNPQGLVNAVKREVVGTDNEFVDSVLDETPFRDIREGDELMDRGRKNRDPEAMDAALKKRPNDLSYNLSRANLALEKGDTATYYELRGRIMNTYASPRQEKSLNDQKISELEAARLRLGGNFQSGIQCRALFEGLADAYYSQGKLDTELGYKRERDRCPE